MDRNSKRNRSTSLGALETSNYSLIKKQKTSIVVIPEKMDEEDDKSEDQVNSRTVSMPSECMKESV